MKEKKAVARELRQRYQKSTKKEKREILDQFCLLTGYNRSYAARVLRQKETKANRSRKRRRQRIYGEEVLLPLKKIWATLDAPCGKRLKPFMSEIISVMEKWGELELNIEVEEKLLCISSSTIDRLLANERKKVEFKSRSSTKPGTLLKNQIPIRTFSEWDEARPGFVEVDLVSHDGGNPKGDFAQTLDMTDIYSSWTETRAVKNKAQRWVFEALKEVRGKLPFALLGLDSDNGSEFINAHLNRFCQQERITFTRSRAYRKNDSCYVEQKNYSVVRKNVGYLRYDTDQEVEVLNKLYGYLRLYTNFFQPTMKLKRKLRVGSRVKKSYDEAKTPYQRLVLSTYLAEEAKSQLKQQYEKLNPVELKRKILKLQNKLLKLYRIKKELQRKEVLTTQPFEYILPEAANNHLEYIFT